MDFTNASNETSDSNLTLDEGMIFQSTELWGFWMKFILTPAIVFVGIVGNTLSLIVMRAKPLRHKSYSHYLSILAVFDTINLVTRQVKNIDEYNVEIKNSPGVFQDFNDASCKTYIFIEHVSYLMSSWLVVLMAIERYIAVCFPFKKVQIFKHSGSQLTICCLLGVISASQVFRLVMVKHIVYPANSSIQICDAGDDYITEYTSVDVYLYQWTLAFTLPVATVLFCNLSVLYQVIKVRRELQRGNEKNSRYNRASKKNHKTTYMLLLVSFIYIATLLPMLTLTLIVDISFKVSSDSMYVWDLYSTLRPYLELSVAISTSNYAVNFFIYVLSGKSFRLELLKMFNWHKVPKRIYTARSTRDDSIRL